MNTTPTPSDSSGKRKLDLFSFLLELPPLEAPASLMQAILKEWLEVTEEVNSGVRYSVGLDPALPKISASDAGALLKRFQACRRLFFRDMEICHRREGIKAAPPRGALKNLNSACISLRPSRNHSSMDDFL